MHAVGLGVGEPGVELLEGISGGQLVSFERSFGVLIRLSVCLIVRRGDCEKSQLFESGSGVGMCVGGKAG